MSAPPIALRGKESLRIWTSSATRASAAGTSSMPPLQCAGVRCFAITCRPRPSPARKVLVFYWLSGLTCTDENFMFKAGAQRIAAEPVSLW